MMHSEFVFAYNILASLVISIISVVMTLMIHYGTYSGIVSRGLTFVSLWSLFATFAASILFFYYELYKMTIAITGVVS